MRRRWLRVLVYSGCCSGVLLTLVLSGPVPHQDADRRRAADFPGAISR
jgi:hypothetical protein